MNKISVLICTISVLIMTCMVSCQKELSSSVNNNTVTASGNKVMTYSETDLSPFGNYSDSFRLSYDVSDRLQTMTSILTPGNKFVWAYGTGSNTMDSYINNVPDIHEVFFLNGHSLVDSTFQYNSTNDSSTEKYIYDASQRLTALREYDFSMVTGSVLSDETVYTYDAAGNTLTETDNSTGEVYTYEYYTDLNSIFMGLGFTPNGTHNLVKKTIYTDGTDTFTATHTYTFDSAHRITSETQVWDYGETLIKRYTY